MNIGTKVKVTDIGFVYPTYKDFLPKDYLPKWKFAELPDITKTYVVVYIGRHKYEPVDLVVIECEDEVFIINKEGLEDVS